MPPSGRPAAPSVQSVSRPIPPVCIAHLVWVIGIERCFPPGLIKPFRDTPRVPEARKERVCWNPPCLKRKGAPFVETDTAGRAWFAASL